MRVTMLGISGSGKTSFMAGLAQRMSQDSVSGYTISPAALSAMDAAFARANLQQIQFAQNNFTFPIGTTSTTTWTFNLLRSGKEVCFFEWIDFRGGYLDQLHDGIKEGNETELQEFLAYVQASDAVIIFVDSIRAVKYHKSPGAFQQFTKVPGIFRFLIDISRNSRPKTFIIVGTKADSDLIPPALQANGFAGLSNIVAEATKSFYTPLLENHWSGAIASVGAVGVGKVVSTVKVASSFREVDMVSTEIKDFPDPVNVELPVLYCLYEELRKAVAVGSRRIGQQNDEIERILAEKTLLNFLWAKIAKVPTPGEEAEHLRKRVENERRVLMAFAPAVPDLEKIVRQRVKIL